MSNAAIAEQEIVDVPGYENVKYDSRLLPIANIQPPEYALRPAQLEDPKFLNLRDSIAKHGLFHNLLIRQLPESSKDRPLYGVIDGLQRYTACKILGIPEVPCRVVDMDEAEIAEAQIIANCVKLDTKPIQLTIQLRRILNSNPTLTRSELAERLDMSEKWLNDRLSLQNLGDPAKALVSSGAMKLNHAFTLAKLQPPEHQDDFLQEAQTDTYSEFAGKIEARMKEVRSANMAGRKAGERQFVAVPHLRKVLEFTEAIDSDKIVNELLATEQPKTLAEAVKVGMKWGVQLDPASVSEKKKRDEQLKAERDIAATKRAEEQAKSRAEKALARAEALGVKASEDEEN